LCEATHRTFSSPGRSIARTALAVEGTMDGLEAIYLMGAAIWVYAMLVYF
jgi:hypothetical protein